MKHHRNLLGLLTILLTLGASGCAWLRPDRAARVATGTTAHDLCSETFISRLDPDQIFSESIKPRPGFEFIAPFVSYDVDRQRGEVRATLAGGFLSRAVYRSDRGCTLVKAHDGELTTLRAPPPAMAVDTKSTAMPLAPAPTGVSEAVDEAFAENVSGALRQTKAVLVLHRGRLIAERYAPDYGPATPVQGFSLSKSVTNALLGLLVRDGKLRLDTPILLTGSPDPAVTLEQAMRMTTGLDLDETGSGFDPANHLLYVHTQDMAAFARSASRKAAPGTRWAYSSASTHLVARAIHDALGPGESVQHFAQQRLFGPLGMERVLIESDETGAPIGAHYTFATARDWARFGQFFLEGGVSPNGQRLLPENWVQWATTPTINTDYGAGWWLNRRAPGVRGAGYDMPLMSDVPADAFYGLGNLGQWLVVVPSHRLVVVRLGRAHTPDFDQTGINRLVSAIINSLAP
jgi:CubicO group peptidase (beta-lactamase class C family)